jgi:hypothetical protein
MNYCDMVVEAVVSLNEKGGSSLPAIRKFISENFGIKKQEVASFNNLTMKALNKAVADQFLEAVGRSYRISANEKERRRRLLLQESVSNRQSTEAARKKSKLGAKGTKAVGRHSTNRWDNLDADFDDNPMVSDLYMGTVYENNRRLRKQLLDLRKKRDSYLFTNCYSVLEPFVQGNVSFLCFVIFT